MKTLTKFIIESISNNSVKNILYKDININDWHWNSAYSDNSYQDKCKKTAKEFIQNSEIIKSLYPDAKPFERIELLYRNTYRDYIGIDSNKSKSQLDNMYEDEMKHLDKVIKETGWGTYESTSLPQGWWAFIYWIIKKIK